MVNLQARPGTDDFEQAKRLLAGAGIATSTAVALDEPAQLGRAVDDAPIARDRTGPARTCLSSADESALRRPMTASPARLRGPQLAATFAIATWSGFFVMSVELLSGRILAPHFGNSIYVWGGVITVFMLGLSFGYLAGGQFSVRSPSLRRLAMLQIVAAATLAPVLVLGEPVLDKLFDHIQDPRWGSIAACLALFFVPTFVSGMVSPYAVRLLVDEARTSGRLSGRLFFFSTFGSAAGTLLTSFWLVLLLEINQILVALIAGSVLVSGTAWLVARRAPAVEAS